MDYGHSIHLQFMMRSYPLHCHCSHDHTKTLSHDHMKTLQINHLKSITRRKQSQKNLSALKQSHQSLPLRYTLGIILPLSYSIVDQQDHTKRARPREYGEVLTADEVFERIETQASGRKTKRKAQQKDVQSEDEESDHGMLHVA